MSTYLLGLIKMKHWNLGNTTIRNPDRILDGLRILKRDFEGKPWTEKEQFNYFVKLKEEEIIESETKDKTNKEIFGRKWAACFNQLGLASAWNRKGNVLITDVGNALLEDRITEEEIFLKQFIKHHLPSPIEHGRLYEGFNVNPFYVILKLLIDLEKEGIKGLTKEEISLFVITCVRNEDINDAERRIKEYRAKYKSITGNVGKKNFYINKKKEIIHHFYQFDIDERKKKVDILYQSFKNDNSIFSKTYGNDLLDKITGGGKGSKTIKAQKFRRYVIDNVKTGNIEDIYDSIFDLYMNTKGKTLTDYSDTTIRYTVKTGLLTISGKSLILKEDMKPLIKKILDEYPIYQDSTYLENYYSSNMPILPSDNIDFLKTNIGLLKNRFVSLQTRLNVKKEYQIDISGIDDPNKLKKVQQELENNNKFLREQIFYKEQARSESIKDILSYYDSILDRSLMGGEAYRPAFMEWTTWRLFLSINNIYNDISETRNFRIDESLYPIHHAKSGEPDMVFEYDDFIIVCEVTLLPKGNQWAEHETVPRHVAKVIKQYDKEVYGIFIAPTIDPNTTNQFFKSDHYINVKSDEPELISLKIIPFTIAQIKEILQKFDRERFNTDDLKIFLKELVLLQNISKSPIHWQKLVNNSIKIWTST